MVCGGGGSDRHMDKSALDVRVRVPLFSHGGFQDEPLGDGLEPFPVLVDTIRMLGWGVFTMVLVALFDEFGAFLVVLEEDGGEWAGDQVPGRGLGLVDLTQVGMGGGFGTTWVTGQHTYIVG